MRILHLSDTHLKAGGGFYQDVVDPVASLRDLLSDMDGLPRLDAVVVSGDVADDGSPEAYRIARRLVGGFAAERSVPVVYAVGNHDGREGFAEVLGAGHFDASGREAASAVFDSPAAERAAVSEAGGFRLVTVDSKIPGKIRGRIGDDQLAWLRGVLAEPFGHGTVLVVHHPPIWLGTASQRALRLGNPDDLAAAIDGTDVRVILCGHFHAQLAGGLGSAAVWATPAVVNWTDLTGPWDRVRRLRGASATLMELGESGPPLFALLQARDPRAGELISEVGADELAAALDADLAED